MARTNDPERTKKALDLYVQGTPIRDAMLEAGYAKGYVEHWHKAFLDRPMVQQMLKDMVTQAAGLCVEDWRAKIAWLVSKLPKGDPSFRDWLKGMEMYGYHTGELRRDTSSRTTVPINIHIHKKEEVIEVEGKEV